MKNTFFTLMIISILIGLPPIRKSEKFFDTLTLAEQVKVEKLRIQGKLHKGNIQQFVDRFSLAPDRETAIEHALDSSLRARVERFGQGMKNVFGEGLGLLKEHYKKYGFFNGTWRIVKTFVLVPFRSWKEIFAGKPGLGDNPFGTLCGAASVIFLGLWIYEEFYY